MSGYVEGLMAVMEDEIRLQRERLKTEKVMESELSLKMKEVKSSTLNILSQGEDPTEYKLTPKDKVKNKKSKRKQIGAKPKPDKTELLKRMGFIKSEVLKTDIEQM